MKSSEYLSTRSSSKINVLVFIAELGRSLKRYDMSISDGKKSPTDLSMHS